MQLCFPDYFWQPADFVLSAANSFFNASHCFVVQFATQAAVEGLGASGTGTGAAATILAAGWGYGCLCDSGARAHVSRKNRNA